MDSDEIGRPTGLYLPRPATAADEEITDWEASYIPEDAGGVSATRPGESPLAGAPGPGSSNFWIIVPSPKAPSTRIVWHYTNTSGALGIITSNTLWATSAALLNDEQELEYGIRIFESCFSNDQVKEELNTYQYEYLRHCMAGAREYLIANHIFVACASEQADSLSQWRGYSGGSGAYCLGFNAKASFSILAPTSSHTSMNENSQESHWREVVYDGSEQEKLAREVLGFVAYGVCPGPATSTLSPEYAKAVSTGLGSISRAVPFLKNSSFSDEREVRICFDASAVPDAVSFRPGRYGVTPYLLLAVDTSRHDQSDYLSVPEATKLPIAEIVVGPAAVRVAAERGLRLLLDNSGHGTVDVRNSEVPFRG